MKAAPEARYKYYYTTNKEMCIDGPWGRVQIILYY